MASDVLRPLQNHVYGLPYLPADVLSQCSLCGVQYINMGGIHICLTSEPSYELDTGEDWADDDDASIYSDPSGDPLNIQDDD